LLLLLSSSLPPSPLIIIVVAVELKAEGANIEVTEENKKEYVKLIVRYRLLRGIADQVRG
jgi:hypothetical protein